MSSNEATAIRDTTTTGTSQATPNSQPTLTTQYLINSGGTYPSRSLSGDDYIGSVGLFAGSFVPTGYLACNGQSLNISDYSALFSIVGTNFGGDGIRTFALPDLRERIPIGAGQGEGLKAIQLGEQTGSDTFSISHTPNHTHSLGSDGAESTSETGDSLTLNTRMPSLGLTPVIATQGTFPSRSLSADPTIGSLSWFAGNFAPRGYAIADGSILSIANNQALFALLGTTYGGDGRSTFGLPDLRGRAAIQAGEAPGLFPIRLGELGGSEAYQVDIATMTTHSHELVNGSTTTTTGNSQTADIQQPYLGVNYQIITQGIYPSRSLERHIEPVNNTAQPPKESAYFTANGTSISSDEAIQQIHMLAEAAQAIWVQAGLKEQEQAKLNQLSYTIADLSGSQLAQVSSENEIIIDSTTDWFIDPTPFTNNEYVSNPRSIHHFQADSGLAQSSYDLLTALLHEQGHILGLSHLDDPNSLMQGLLQRGTRKLPSQETTSDSLTTLTPKSEPLSGTGEGFLGSISMVAYNFPSPNTAMATGAVIGIQQNAALYSLIGNFYGGNGVSTMQLPDLRGRAVMGTSNDHPVGLISGRSGINFSLDELPSHDHAYTPIADLTIPSGTTKSIADNYNNEPNTTNQASGFILNNGVLSVSGTLSNNSSGIIENNGSIVLTGTLTNGANATIINNGTINASDATLFTNTGQISGTGTIQGDLNNSGTLSPGNSPGNIKISGDYNSSATANKLIELGGTTEDFGPSADSNHDWLHIMGDATLNGSLNVQTIEGFELTTNQRFEVITIDGERSGKFNELNEGDCVLESNNICLKITYASGDGNDIALYTESLTPLSRSGAGWDSSPSGSSNTATEARSIYRFFNTLNGSHFYTSSQEEATQIIHNSLGDEFTTDNAANQAPASGAWPFQYEGVQCITTGSADDLAHRFYNPSTGRHFFTTDENEAATLMVSTLDNQENPWIHEGLSFPLASEMADGLQSLFRFYNPSQGDHFWTTSMSEAEHVVKQSLGENYSIDTALGIQPDASQGWGYLFEGIAGYL